MGETLEPAGEVDIDVAASALNFKDWLVAQPRSRVRRSDSLTLGVEAAGVVRASRAGTIQTGQAVIVFGDGFGVSADGGFAERASAPARYVTALPEGLSPTDAVTYGLAGFTAAAAAQCLADAGVQPGDGEVVVTGASGGVGSTAVAVLARRGYAVVASTGSPQHGSFLLSLGASRVVGRDDLSDRPERVLASERWAGAVDCVGGATLHEILRATRYGGAVVATGLVGASDLVTTVYPFITRAVSLIGVDAVEASPAARARAFAELATLGLGAELRERTIGLDAVPSALEEIGRGTTRGRWLVRPQL